MFGRDMFVSHRVRIVALVAASLAALAAAAAGVACGETPADFASSGAWQRLPTSPIAPEYSSATSVWTGKQMLVFGTNRGVSLAAAFDPATSTWRRVPDAGPAGTFPPYQAVWTGKEMLVLGQGVRKGFDPRTNTWRQLPGSPLLRVHEGHGLVVWTGKELIGWGGGCCGDAFSDGVAYNPVSNRWRALPRGPLAGSQHPIGAWTGHELVVLVGNVDPDGKPWPARLARAAAYNPATNTWRRIAPLPAEREGASAVWDGRELLVVGGGIPRGDRPPAPARTGLAYNPSTNSWRQLAPMAGGRTGGVAVWTGRRLLLWGGRSVPKGTPLRTGVAYDPKLDRWSALPQAPLPAGIEPTAVWTGKQLVVWGGVRTASGAYRALGATLTTAP
jgi:hypothetical protein